MSKAQTATKPAAKKQPTKAQLAKGVKLFGEAAMKGDENHEITEEQRKEERRAADKARIGQNTMAFAVQHLGAPVAPLTTPPQAVEAFQKELAELQAKHGITTPVKVKMPKADKIVSNGITRPNAESLCGKIWKAADELSAESHGVATIAALKLHADVHGVNEHTIKTQYARWRSFNNITGRLPKIQAVHQTAGEYEGMTPVKAAE